MTDENRDARELLERRARRLARRPPPVREAPVRTLLCFRVDEQTFAIAAERVLEIVQVDRLTPLPGATHAWIALAFWRGQVVAVKDIHAGRERRFAGERSTLVIVDAPQPFALYTHGASDLMTIEEAALHHPPADSQQYGAWTEAVTAEAVVVISIDRLIDHDPRRRST